MEKVIERLKEINLKLDTIISALQKPDNKLARVFEIVATGGRHIGYFKYYRYT
jgi:hypothetical protein